MKNDNAFKSVDKLSKELDAVDNFVLKNWKRYIVLAALTLAVCAGAMLVMGERKTMVDNAALAIESARTIPDLKGVISKGGGSALAVFAKLRLASLLVVGNKGDEAVSIYRGLQESSASDFIKSFSALNEAYSLEVGGKRKQASEMFSRIANNASLPIQVRGEALFSAGRAYAEAGNKVEARKYLGQCALINNDDCFGWPTLAQSMLNAAK